MQEFHVARKGHSQNNIMTIMSYYFNALYIVSKKKDRQEIRRVWALPKF